MITTNSLMDITLKRYNVCRENILGDVRYGSTPSEDASLFYALEALERTSKVVSYCYRDLRGKSQLSATYMDVSILVHSCAGRTLVTFQKIDSYPEVSATFIGADEGVSVGIQSAYSPDNESLYALLRTVEQFAKVCTPEIFLQDNSVRIA